jgi:hypothetical protein
MMQHVTATSTIGATPEFTALCKTLYGGLVDADEVWDTVSKLAPDHADTHANTGPVDRGRLALRGLAITGGIVGGSLGLREGRDGIREAKAAIKAGGKIPGSARKKLATAGLLSVADSIDLGVLGTEKISRHPSNGQLQRTGDVDKGLGEAFNASVRGLRSHWNTAAGTLEETGGAAHHASRGIGSVTKPELPKGVKPSNRTGPGAQPTPKGVLVDSGKAKPIPDIPHYAATPAAPPARLAGAPQRAALTSGRGGALVHVPGTGAPRAAGRATRTPDHTGSLMPRPMGGRPDPAPVTGARAIGPAGTEAAPKTAKVKGPKKSKVSSIIDNSQPPPPGGRLTQILDNAQPPAVGTTGPAGPAGSFMHQAGYNLTRAATTAEGRTGIGVGAVGGTGLDRQAQDRGARRQREQYAMGKADITWEGTFAKLDADKHLAFGWASVTKIDGQDVIDKQGDYIPLEEIESAAYTYVIGSRVGGDMHRRNGMGQFVGKRGVFQKSVGTDTPHKVSDMVESMVFTPEKISKMGLPSDFTQGWWVGFKIHDEPTWDLVKKGERTGFSIHGRGRRVDADIDEIMGYTNGDY